MEAMLEIILVIESCIIELLPPWYKSSQMTTCQQEEAIGGQMGTIILLLAITNTVNKTSADTTRTLFTYGIHTVGDKSENEVAMDILFPQLRFNEGSRSFSMHWQVLYL